MKVKQMKNQQVQIEDGELGIGVVGRILILIILKEKHENVIVIIQHLDIEVVNVCVKIDLTQNLHGMEEIFEKLKLMNNQQVQIEDGAHGIGVDGFGQVMIKKKEFDIVFVIILDFYIEVVSV